MRMICLTVALLAFVSVPLAAQDTTTQRQDTAPDQAAPSNISVEVVLTSAVVERMPQDTVTTIPAPDAAAMDTLFLWTRVSGAEPGTVLHHVWFWGDEQVGDVSLNINGSPWRTWSSKVIPAEATGAWRVEVRDETGNVLGTVHFTVGS